MYMIDLSGPQGNAFFLIGTAKTAGKLMGLEASKIASIQKEMMSSDYENLKKVFLANFGELYAFMED